MNQMQVLAPPEQSSKRLGRIRVSLELLATMFLLPAGTKVLGCRGSDPSPFAFRGDEIEVTIESERLPEIAPGACIPLLSPLYSAEENDGVRSVRLVSLDRAAEAVTSEVGPRLAIPTGCYTDTPPTLRNTPPIETEYPPWRVLTKTGECYENGLPPSTFFCTNQNFFA
jgi:hypothetical protein